MSVILYLVLALATLARAQNYVCDCYPNTRCEDTSWAVFKNGLYWAWASPCSGGCSDLPHPLPYGWRRATTAEWQGGYPNFYDFDQGGKCASHIFDPDYDHCDHGDFNGGYVIYYDNNHNYETLIVHDPCVTPEPTPVPTPIPTPYPTPQPSEESGCVTSAQYNVQFIIDESGSVGSDGYEMSIDFVQDLILNDISPDAPISVFEFASAVQIIYRFDNIQSPRTNMINVIEGADYDGGWTATATAVQYGIDEWNRAIAAGGELVDGERLMFIMTDGFPNQGGDPCTKKAALDALDITVIIIGVGSGFSRSAVECLADNDRDSIIEIADFTQDAFDAVEDEISVTTCPPDDGCVTTTEYDVQFLIDESGSVPLDGYELSIDFIQGLIQNDISADAKVSVFEFGSNVQIIYRFDNIQQPRDNMIQVIEDADYDSGGTRTGDAVQAGINEWERAEANNELSGGEKLMFILTDGRPNGGVNPCTLKDDLDALGVTVIIIGVGNFNRAQVDCLAVNDRDSVIEVADFSQDAFDAVEDEISETTCPDGDITVPEDPLPCREAQQFCKDKYGTNLATIITDDDRTAAQTALNEASEMFGFIGLYSDDVETKWQFRSGATCPSASAYKCVDFWRTAPGGFNNRPRCIGDGEGGFGCAVIYADDGTVDNDILDTAPFPFLCDLP